MSSLEFDPGANPEIESLRKCVEVALEEVHKFFAILEVEGQNKNQKKDYAERVLAVCQQIEKLSSFSSVQQWKNALRETNELKADLRLLVSRFRANAYN